MARQVAMPLRMSRSTVHVMHTKFKYTKVYLTGVLVDYTAPMKISCYTVYTVLCVRVAQKTPDLK